jgi:hypothetical protein
VCLGNELREVAVARWGGGEQREVALVSQCQFGAGDGTDAGGVGGLSELHRAVEAVMIGDGEGAIAELEGTANQLVGHGCTIQKREGRV